MRLKSLRELRELRSAQIRSDLVGDLGQVGAAVELHLLPLVGRRTHRREQLRSGVPASRSPHSLCYVMLCYVMLCYAVRRTCESRQVQSGPVKSSPVHSTFKSSQVKKEREVPAVGPVQSSQVKREV